MWRGFAVPSGARGSGAAAMAEAAGEGVVRQREAHRHSHAAAVHPPWRQGLWERDLVPCKPRHGHREGRGDLHPPLLAAGLCHGY